ncbi:MAG: hypothetical protein PHQ36_08210 [Anaerolineales bacterium]|nr:hypothetical protein [Anaerolineales bacterium]
MKEILLPILACILFACSPNAPALQVTVIPKMTVTLPVTQTSTPTSTAVIWQDADGKWYRGSKPGEKSALLNENNTWSVIVAPGLYKNGSEFTLQLADGTEVTLSDKDMVFDKDGKWQSVNGYELKDGKWVVAEVIFSSADGTVLWTEEGMAGGELRVQDRKAKELRNKTISALWAVNNSLVNPRFIKDFPQNIIDDHAAFLKQFPSASALVRHVEKGGEPVTLYVPVNNPYAQSARYIKACGVEKLENIDLSQVMVGFDVPKKSETMSDDANDFDDFDYSKDPYCDINFTVEQMRVEPVTSPSGSNILSWKFRMGSEWGENAVKKSKLLRYPLYQELSAEEKLMGASQVFNMVIEKTIDQQPKYTEVMAWADPPMVVINYAKLANTDWTSFNYERLAGHYFELAR